MLNRLKEEAGKVLWLMKEKAGRCRCLVYRGKAFRFVYTHVGVVIVAAGESKLRHSDSFSCHHHGLCPALSRVIISLNVSVLKKKESVFMFFVRFGQCTMSDNWLGHMHLRL